MGCRLKHQVQSIFASLKLKAETSSVQQEATRRYYEQLIFECNNLSQAPEFFNSHLDFDKYDPRTRLSTHSIPSLSQRNIKMPPIKLEKLKSSRHKSPQAKPGTKVPVKPPSKTSRSSLPKASFKTLSPSLSNLPEPSKKLKPTKPKKSKK